MWIKKEEYEYLVRQTDKLNLMEPKYSKLLLRHEALGKAFKLKKEETDSRLNLVQKVAEDISFRLFNYYKENLIPDGGNPWIG